MGLSVMPSPATYNILTCPNQVPDPMRMGSAEGQCTVSGLNLVHLILKLVAEIVILFV